MPGRISVAFLNTECEVARLKESRKKGAAARRKN